MKPMKVATKRALIISTPIIIVLVLTILALSLIRVNPIKPFLDGDFKVTVVNAPINSPQNEAKADSVKEGVLDLTSFSVMRSLLEFNADFSIKPIQVENEDELEYKKYSASDFSILRAGLNQFMLRFEFNETKTNKKFVKENGDLIKFQHLIMIIDVPNGDIQPIRLFPYMEINLDNDFFDLEEENENGYIYDRYYSVYEFSAKLYTNSLYELLVDLGFNPQGSIAQS